MTEADDIIKKFKENLETCPVCGAPIGFFEDSMGTIYGLCSNISCTFKAEVDYR